MNFQFNVEDTGKTNEHYWKLYSIVTYFILVYPKFTGAWKNHSKLRLKYKTFADELKNHTTAYLGKWHLNGKTKSSTDFGDETRKFGFSNIKYQYNRGHWKYFNETEDGLKAYEWNERERFTQSGVKESDHYATDFLVDRTIEFIDEELKNGNKFALMLSIADPHGTFRTYSSFSHILIYLNIVSTNLITAK